MYKGTLLNTSVLCRDLSNNAISELSEGAFRDTALLQDLLLQHNRIETVPQGAFVGLHQLQVLNLEHNLISFLHPDTFLPLHNIEDLNLGNNVFPELPSRGLEHVLHLKVHNNRHLRQFPGPQSFPAVLSLVLSYAYHCCPFLNLDVATDTARLGSENTSRAQTPQLIHEDVVFSLEGLQRHDPRLWNHTHAFWPYYPVHPSSNFTALWANLAGRYPAAGTASSANSTNASTKHEGSELHTIASSTPRYPEEPFYVPGDFSKTWLELSGAGSMMGEDELRNQHSIQCIPQPGPFMPCRDLFDWWTLRCGVWLVFLLALMGNGVVVVVLIAAYAKMDVPRFLVTNLAMADFLMGVYLGFLAVVDASTLGEFRMYAIPWQMSAGCQLAGFLGVLSSELSVYTLTVITLERNYAIIHAMNLNKRLSLRHAAYIMAIGWIFALTMAVLPLTGVSDYRKFAVCLPFETDGAGLGYVVFLMVINGVAFMILMGCYLKIYCAIRGSQAWNSNDSRIAKRMALLVFTDFICWAPIAFFSLSAAYGLQLISLEEAKVFTVFVLPLNSCCNPFLYALLTKQFKKDCVMLCKAIEESRVTRGIGRCRHSSNFSNRQTPVNTNSALDSKSRDTCSCGAAEKRRSRPTQFIDFICCRKTRLSAGTYSKGHRRNLSPKKEVGRSNAASANWSWRGGWRSTQKPGPLRLLDLRKPASLDLTRKSSQESSLSSSRHDSSSASTATWRVSRSSVSSDASKTDSASRPGSQREDSRAGNTSRNPSRGGGGGKPRLQRQRAIEKDTQGISRLNCPVHHREELSCVYEQASIEEAAEIKMNPSPRFAHRRSLSDGLLFCTITATQPISGVQPNPAALLVRSPTVLPTTILPSTPEIEKQDSVSQDSDTDKPRLLETHFPLDNDNGDGVPKEASPLL
ncbi:Leucine-rich repeat [Trinorchestia longiramus]|nr:Leucine-rich repeat [Trinorchestia longiramus]